MKCNSGKYINIIRTGMFGEVKVEATLNLRGTQKEGFYSLF